MSSQQPEKSEAFRHGHSRAQLDFEKGHWRIGEMKCAESKAGYDAGWSEAFFAKYEKRQPAAPQLF